MSTALDALSLRQQVIAQNIANVQTPGYQGRRVSFEDSLAQAVRNGSGVVEPSIGISLEPTREDGNNVNLDTEVVSNTDTSLRYQAATRAVEGTFTSLRTAMRTA
ncbi:flagellar basal body rod protein FlgB [Demequina litorisediminis]|uniref:Flagellar basal body rod protein FlgB n=1 Tax=Demequina litorisediminis TaxID=1849022 RepID=A0ABQ6ICU4_9MICO|nr:flagellar basal body rod protein FlgB [Demequina litorisediminis]